MGGPIVMQKMQLPDAMKIDCADPGRLIYKPTAVQCLTALVAPYMLNAKKVLLGKPRK
jgi:hypothetical protein